MVCASVVYEVGDVPTLLILSDSFCPLSLTQMLVLLSLYMTSFHFGLPPSLPWFFVLPQVHVAFNIFYHHIVHVDYTFVITMFIFKLICLLSSDSSCCICSVLINVELLSIIICHQQVGDCWEILLLSARTCSPSNLLNIMLSSVALNSTGEMVSSCLRGHVNKKNSKKTLAVGGWVKCQIGNFKKLENIFIHSFITFLGEHSNVNNVINVLLCLCSCFYVQVFVVNYFWDFPEFFFLDGGWVGCIVSKLCLYFYIFFIFTMPLTPPLIVVRFGNASTLHNKVEAVIMRIKPA